MNEAFFNNLARLMSKSKMNESDLARAVGVSRAAINCWVKGKAMPKAQHLMKLSDVFKCSVDELLGHGEKTPEVLALDEIITTFGREYTRLESEKRVKIKSIFFDNVSGDLEITIEKGEEELAKEYGRLNAEENRTLLKNGYPGSLIVKTV